MKSEKTSSGACGVINNAGGDKYAHLGHFRSAKVLEKGHNQGAPGGGGLDLNHPTMNPLSNPEGFAATTSRPVARAGGNMGAPVSGAGPMAPAAQPALQRIGGNMGAPGAAPGIMGTPGAAPAKPPASPGDALQGLAKLVGRGGVTNRSTGAGAGATKRPTMKAMNTAKEPKTSSPAGKMNLGSGERSYGVSAPKAALQGATDVLRKTRQGVRGTMRGGKKPKM